MCSALIDLLLRKVLGLDKEVLALRSAAYLGLGCLCEAVTSAQLGVDAQVSAKARRRILHFLLFYFLPM